MQIIYTGHSASGVHIADTGQHAPHGEAIEVDDDVATRLLEQSGSWNKAAKPAKAGN